MGGCGGSIDFDAIDSEQEIVRRKTATYTEELLEPPLVLNGAEAKALIEELANFDATLAHPPYQGFVVGSTTDEDKTTRKDKPRSHLGQNLDLKGAGVGVCCAKGHKPSINNQDSWVVVRYEPFSIYGVMDGHGPQGHHVSHFVRSNLHKLILKDPRFRVGDMKAMLRDCFHSMQAMVRQAHSMKYFDASLSGTTVTVAIHDRQQNQVWVAWVGDSQACVGAAESNKSEKLSFRLGTWEHKPELAGETQRIEARGGQVKPGPTTPSLRVHVKGQRYPALNMSRCMGSLIGHDQAGLIAEPAILNYQVDSLDKVLLVCSDGVWQFVSVGHALNSVRGTTQQNCDEKVDKLLDLAWKEWSQDTCGFIDDITIVLAFLQCEYNLNQFKV